MPRQADGTYVLPSGNPVIQDTVIEAAWANTTMPDLGNAITGSVARNGTAGMTGPLELARDAITPLEPITKRQFDAALQGDKSFLVAGTISFFAMNVTGNPPSAWLVCDGASYDTTIFSDLFGAIGYTYGGTGALFKVPDLRGQFLRGWDSGNTVDINRPFGSKQSDSNKQHSHGLNDTGHTHGITVDPHTHAITQTPHSHSYVNTGGPVAGNTGNDFGITGTSATGAANANITIDPATVTGGVQDAVTGISVNNDPAAASESRPVNVAMVACIRAYGSYITGQLGSMAYQNADSVSITNGGGNFATLTCTRATPPVPGDVLVFNDISLIGGVQSITSSNLQMIAVNSANPNSPVIQPQTNLPLGIPQLDANGKIPSSLLSVAPTTYQGTWNAALNAQNPTERGGTGYNNGDLFQVAIAGTCNLRDPAGTVVPAQAVSIGDTLIYVLSQPPLPDGWYYQPVATPGTLPATSVTVVPVGGIAATNCQSALQELDTEKANALNAVLTGNPTAPTQATADSDTSVATTAFVHNVVNAIVFPAVPNGNYGDITVSGVGNDWQINAGAVGANETTAVIAKTNVAQNYTAPQRNAPTVDNDGNFDLTVANNFSCTPAAPFVLTFTGIASQPGQTGIIRLNNAAGVAVTKDVAVRSSGTMLATISAVGLYLLSYYCDGSNVYVTNSAAMS